MSFWKQHARSLVVLAVVIAGLLITSPYFNYQDYLSQGDHGRDLYAAQAVYRGELPYKGFWWVYGPLTPYYYGLFFKIFGTKITSMILGKIALRILAGIFVCFALMEIGSPVMAFLCACWFMLFQQDFFFTYNHIAGLAMITGVVWRLLSYIQTNTLKAAWGALGFVFVLCLIKINFGLAALAVTVITVAVSDFARRAAWSPAKKYFYIVSFIALPLLLFVIYWSLLHGLSEMEIRQCLPYKEGDQPYEINPWQAIAIFLKTTWHTIRSSWMSTGFAVLINASALRCVYLLVKNRMPAARRISFLLSIGMLIVFYLFNSHEFLKSGVWYREFWAQPLSIMISFVFIEIAAQSIPETLRKAVYTCIAAMLIICWALILHAVNAIKTPDRLLDLPRAGIYISNSPSWIKTVDETTQFLNKTLKPDELFFALPYDCLYYYLTDKKTPTRQLIFFMHIKIPLEQDKAVIVDLEKNHVNYVLLSSRAFAHQEYGLGILGKDYCPLIWKYLNDNFAPIARFGDWTNEPGWAWNHGTLILKRKGT